jgi:glutamate-1-semialdehyde 2,1-aminomutase
MTDGSAIETTYRTHTTKSRELWERFCAVMPSGVTRAAAWYSPYPVVAHAARGAELWDADGNQYLDCLNNYTSLVHGNAHPSLDAAAARASCDGTAFALPHALQAEHAQRLAARIASVERVRYTNSGTEAAMLAVRVARAFTGRRTIIKADGGYHGFYDGLWPATVPGQADGGPGIPAGVAACVAAVKFNDLVDLDRVCAAAGGDLAAIILEPMLGAGGCRPANPEFLAGARRLADEHGALLILDEVQTIRLAPGGLQAEYDVSPDLTVLGKAIGGGLPVGAVSGRGAPMSVCEVDHPSGIAHSGTFNGHLSAMSAGIAALELLDEAAVARINGYGRRLAAELRQQLEQRSLSGSVTGWGSILHLHLDRSQDQQQLHLALLNEGVVTAARGMLNVSTAMDDTIVGEIARRYSRALDAVAEEVAA